VHGSLEQLYQKNVDLISHAIPKKRMNAEMTEAIMAL
jgi:hypothetical protein